MYFDRLHTEEHQNSIGNYPGPYSYNGTLCRSFYVLIMAIKAPYPPPPPPTPLLGFEVTREKKV